MGIYIFAGPKLGGDRENAPTRGGYARSKPPSSNWDS